MKLFILTMRSFMLIFKLALFVHWIIREWIKISKMCLQSFLFSQSLILSFFFLYIINNKSIYTSLRGMHEFKKKKKFQYNDPILENNVEMNAATFTGLSMTSTLRGPFFTLPWYKMLMSVFAFWYLRLINGGPLLCRVC